MEKTDIIIENYKTTKNNNIIMESSPSTFEKIQEIYNNSKKLKETTSLIDLDNRTIKFLLLSVPINTLQEALESQLINGYFLEKEQFTVQESISSRNGHTYTGLLLQNYRMVKNV